MPYHVMMSKAAALLPSATVTHKEHSSQARGALRLLPASPLLSLVLSLCVQLLMSIELSASGRHAMVVCAHPEAARVGRDILRHGGNAVDAAVAVQFALAVVYPNAGNIGGGGFLLWRSQTGDVRCLDFREKAPVRATRDMFLDPQGNPRTKLSLEGALAAGVPGTVDGMAEAHKTLGSMSWKELLQPAINLARKGFRITEKQAADLNEHEQSLRLWNPGNCALVRTGSWKRGDRIVQPQLATTLEAIRDKGRDGFYAGACAHALLQCMRQHQGIIDSADLQLYHSVWRKAVHGLYRGYDVYSMPPPSSGGVALLQLLWMWERLTQTSRPAFHSAGQIHLMAECERRVYADRAEWMGDPDAVRVPTSGLLKEEYLRTRIATIRGDTATPSVQVHAGQPSMSESEQTTHFSIVDRQGNAVALTTTLNASYGAKLMVEDAGFLLNNEMDDFSVKPGVPNMYGLTGDTANAISPGKRMLSSMTPTLLTRGGKLVMVIGTPGGGTIINSVFQCIVNVLDYHMSMQQAVEKPRFHHQWMPDAIYVEDGCLPDGVAEKLRVMGHRCQPRGPMGRVDAILIDHKGGLSGAADPRGDDCIGSF